MSPWTRLFVALAVLASVDGTGSTTSGSVQVLVDVNDRQPISPYIYGLNFAESPAIWGQKAPTGITFTRLGGNRLSAYNWETNASNCGNDCNGTFPNDRYLGDRGGGPAQPARAGVAWAMANRGAFLGTISMLGFVAADTAGPVPLQSALAQRRASRFLVSKPRKGSRFSDRPDVTDGVVYQDELVGHLRSTHPPGTPIWYSLDNEPDLWGSTHEQIRGNRLGTDKYVLTGYRELTDLSIEYASAVKDAAPDALIFGPALSNWNGFVNLFHNNRPDPEGKRFFLEYYLERMRRAGEAQGRRLLDVLDVHWYSEATSPRHQSVANEWAEQDWPMVQTRVQSPRSLWDPHYLERSWVSKVTEGPIRLLPRLRAMIAAHHPGTRIAITEYFYHRGGDISGAIAQADALGIFGREGVFAAALWPQGARWAYQGNLAETYACALAAFRSFRDHDGLGAAFGDVSLRATTSDNERVSLYASGDSADSSRIVMVAINKSAAPIHAAITMTGGLFAGRVEIWRLSGEVGRCAGPLRVTPDVQATKGAFSVLLPPLTVSTLVVTP